MKLAYFIRLGGCDVGCHWCDVKESWDPNSHPSTELNDIYNTYLRTRNWKDYFITFVSSKFLIFIWS